MAAADCVLCEVSAEAKYTVVMFETGGVHDEVRAEAEEIVEHRVSGAILNVEYGNLRDIYCEISPLRYLDDRF